MIVDSNYLISYTAADAAVVMVWIVYSNKLLYFFFCFLFYIYYLFIKYRYASVALWV